MNENYLKYYFNFERPPFAPTFFPSVEEFADPISYIAKIKGDAEKYGVVKIRPPAFFRPPFAINGKNFNFTPRVQKLNQIDALVRAKLIFDAQLAGFWLMQGQTLEMPTIENKLVDLHSLYTVVVKYGGPNVMDAQKLWGTATKRLGFKQQRANKMKAVYFRWIHDFYALINKNKDNEGDESEDCISSINESKNEHIVHKIRRTSQSRTRPISKLHVYSKERKLKTSDLMEEVVCKKCGMGDHEDYLLLCEDCDRALHTYCCSPPLLSLPKFAWRCHQCLLASVKNIGESFAFHDSRSSYNLLSFSTYAKNWKESHFAKNSFEVSSEEMEREFWQSVIDTENTVVVKYGADLAVNEVGSGFPIKGYDFGGEMDSKEYQFYADHPWNLNNLPVMKDSVLSHMETGISGMMVPWVYVGMCLSAFCWHTEDHWTYSVNYLHWGERKIWYGVSGEEGKKFDEVMMELAPYLFENQPDVLHHMTTTINPSILMEKGINVYTVHQEPGDFVVTFPRSYHAGYNEGLNFAEAVNFAPADWLRKGRSCISEYAHVHRNCVFSHEELIIKMAKCVNQLSTNICIAVHEELHAILFREKYLRSIVGEKGIKKTSFIEYEYIPDDLRTCLVCKTTLFMSSISCKHKRIVCLEHIDHICSKCPTTSLIFNYRYSPEELKKMYRELSKGVLHFFVWRNELLSVINNSTRDLETRMDQLYSLINISKEQQYPLCVATNVAMNILSSSGTCTSIKSNIKYSLLNKNIAQREAAEKLKKLYRENMR